MKFLAEIHPFEITSTNSEAGVISIKEKRLAVPCSAVMERSEKTSLDPNKQTTIAKAVTLSGRGLFTAEDVDFTMHPAGPNTGIIFQRSDLPGKPRVAADLDHVVSTPRCTIIGNKQFTIHTVEHVLSALAAMGIDNAVLELNASEVPIMDGSARTFVEAIQKAGVIQQDDDREIHYLQTPVSWSQGEVHLVAIPSDCLQISYTLHFPHSEILHAQYYSTPVTSERFSKEIAPCRTFCVYEEIAPLVEKGMIKGGGLDNAIIIKNDVVVNPDGVRFADEMVRHKILDLIGDISLIPIPFIAHIIAIRSGHTSNIAFAGKLLQQIIKERS